MNRAFSSGLPCLALLLIGSATFAAPVQAQGRPEFTFRLSSEFDTNVFLLTRGKKRDVTSLGGSGRFVDMESPTDILTTASAEMTLNATGIGSRRLSVIPSFDYSYYAQNSARSEFTVGLGLEHRLRHDGRIRLRGKFTPEHFTKNYLLDAIDSSGDGIISLDERNYVPGAFSEAAGELDFRFRLAKSTRAAPFGAFLRLGGGFESRTYAAPFTGRDRSGLTAMLAFDLDLTRSIGLDLDYGFTSLSNTPSSQVLLIDEPKIGSDLNANGNQTDLDVRTVAMVDRSRTVHAIGATFHIEVSRTNIQIGYEARIRSHSSQEPLDVSHNGRNDMRHALEAKLDTRLAHGVRGFIGAGFATQTLNRELDVAATGDVSDYSKTVVRVGLRFKV